MSDDLGYLVIDSLRLRLLEERARARWADDRSSVVRHAAVESAAERVRARLARERPARVIDFGRRA